MSGFLGLACSQMMHTHSVTSRTFGGDLEEKGTSRQTGRETSLTTSNTVLVDLLTAAQEEELKLRR